MSGLQNEYQEAGEATPPPPTNAHKGFATRNDKVFNDADFRRFWQRLCRRTDYEINVDTEKLIDLCVHKLNRTPFPDPQIVITKGEFVMVDYRIRLVEVKAKMCKFGLIITDTNNNLRQQQQWFHPGIDLARHVNDPNLKGFRITKIVQNGDESKVIFSDRGELTLGQMVQFQKKSGLKTNPISQHEAQTTYPVFKNPEGFTSIFIKTILDVLANHVADKIQYTLREGLEAYEIEAIFSAKQKFPQKELLDGSAASLYDQVQVDSEVERRFVTNRLNVDMDKVICYFKFPYKFKINMPKIIGNYNPDWGIIRWDDDGAIKLELVRETKGNIDPNLLQYQHENRKIQCAEAFFETIGVDYRQITDEVVEWWKRGEKDHPML